MKRNFKKLLVLVILFAIIVISGRVKAATASMSLISNSRLVENQTVEVTLKILNIDAGDGIDAIKGTLNYDKNVFEEVTDQNFEGINRWNILEYSSETGIFKATRSTKVNMQSDVLKITLKAKAAVIVNSSIIEIKEISTSGGDVASGGTGDIQVQAVNVTINKVSQIPDSSTNTQVNQQIQTPNVESNEVSGVVKGNNASDAKLPQTGEEYWIVLAIAVVAIVSIIAYVRYRNINIK